MVREITDNVRAALHGMADAHDKALGLIRHAIECNAHEALGYPNVTTYVDAEFRDALARLPLDARRPVVAELNAAGMSQRAIAGVVGTSKGSVLSDLRAVARAGKSAKPAPAATGFTRPVEEPRVSHGLDGKTRTHQTTPEKKAPAVPPATTDPAPVKDTSPPARWGNRRKPLDILRAVAA